jgi:hypothetical protein
MEAKGRRWWWSEMELASERDAKAAVRRVR